MDIESRIRSKIESILINDERNYAELKAMACEDEPFGDDPFEEERNLYQRIINSYRSAVSEVNGLLEENVGFLSGFYRIIEGIKSTEDFQEICSVIVDCLLRDFGVEYCSIILYESKSPEQARFCMEGIREERKFVFFHSGESLLGNTEFEAEVANMVADSPGILVIPDVYREPRFNAVDFPGVVRSLACLPIIRNGAIIGNLLLCHSLPHHFKDNHIRVLRILASMVAHLRVLTGRPGAAPVYVGPAADVVDRQDGSLSVVILQFEPADRTDRTFAPSQEFLNAIRSFIAPVLGPKASVLLYDEENLLVLLPGIGAEDLPERVRSLRVACEAWRSGNNGQSKKVRLNMGYSTCGEGEDLARTLQIALLTMRGVLEE